MAETLATPGRRVKVYVLNGAGKWDDRGTGHVRVETDPDTKALVLKVTSDETGRVSLTSTIRATHEAFYQMQEDNIISWNEEIPAGVPTEVALSFQETEGCRELWEKICHVDAAVKRTAAQRASAGNSRTQPGVSAQSGGCQGAPADGTATDPLASDANVPSTAAENLHHHANATDGVPLVDPTAPDTAHSRFFDDNLEGSAWGNADAIDDVVFPDTANVLFLGNSPASFVPASSADAAPPSTFVIPEPDRAGVEALARIMSDQATLSMRVVREEIIAEVLTSDYITKLCQVFRRAECDSDLDCLAMLYHVIRCLFVIGNNGVLEILVSEKHLMDIVGCLEYDQEHMTELERKKAESKRKEDKKQSNSATSPEAPSVVPKTSISSEQRDEAERKRMSEEKEPKEPHKEEKLGISESPGLTAASQQQTAMEVETSKETSDAKERQSTSGADKNTRHGDEIGEKTAAADTTQRSGLAASKDTSCHANESPTEKNNSEETSSSGNIPDGEAPRFSLRTHRDYLERKVSYRSVVPINDQNVVAKIHQNYRVAYIRDVILSRVFDDGMTNMLSGVILCNNVDIIMYFISGSTALQELFTRLKTTVQNRRRMQEATLTSGQSAYSLPKHKGTGLVKRPREEDAPLSHKVASTYDPAESLPNVQSNEVKDIRANSGHEQDTNSSSGLDTSPTSNPISLTTADSCPATDPNVVTSADHSSRHAREEEKKLPDSATGDPKSSEQSDEFREDLRSMLGLLRELCQVVKRQQPAVQGRFHQMLLELGALEISVGLLLDKDPVLRSLCCDILSTAIYHDQGDVRAHIMKNATQQHSSVPKQQIGSRKVSAGAKPIEGTAIVTEAGASGVTAEVAIGEVQVSIVEKKSTGSSAAPDVDMSAGDGPAKIPAHKHISIGTDRATATVHSHGTQAGSGSGSECKEGSKRATDGKSQDSDSKGSEGVDAASNLTSAARIVQTAVTSDEASVGTHPMVSASLGEPEKGVKSERQNDAFRPNVLTSGENQSRVETDFPLLSAMIEVICQDKESGVALTVLDLLRTLLDPMNMKPSVAKSLFLNAFYEKFVFRLMAPIEVAAHPERRNSTNEMVSVENVSHICDLMSYCVSHHAFRSKYFVVGDNVGGKIVELVRHKRAHIRLSGVRFVRTCVGMRDDVYDRYVVEKRLMDPVMELYSKNKYKDNLTSSSVLDLISFLATTKREFLLRHIIAEYSATLQPSTKNCSVFEDAKRVLCGIEKDKTLHVDGKNQSKDSDQGNASQLRAGEAGAAEQRSFLGKNDTDDIPHTRGGVFLSHLDDGEVSNQMVMHSTFRDGAVAGNMRFGTSFHGHDMRMFNEEDAFFTRLTGVSDVVHKLIGTDQESVELQLKSGAVGSGLGYTGRSPEQGAMRPLETRGLGTPRGLLSKASFKTGLRSVSQIGLPKRGQGGVKSTLSTGLRSQAVPLGDAGTPKSPKLFDANRRSPETIHATLTKGKSSGQQSNDKDVIMRDEMPTTTQPDAITPEFHEGSNQPCKGKAIRMSLSKSKAKNGELTELTEREDEVLLSESSEDRHSPRKRGKVDNENSIETCTKSVLGRRTTGEDSPTKRRRVEEGTSREDKAVTTEDGTDGEDKVETSEHGSESYSEKLECESKSADATKPNEESQKVDNSMSNRSSDGQGDRERRR